MEQVDLAVCVFSLRSNQKKQSKKRPDEYDSRPTLFRMTSYNLVDKHLQKVFEVRVDKYNVSISTLLLETVLFFFFFGESFGRLRTEFLTFTREDGKGTTLVFLPRVLVSLLHTYQFGINFSRIKGVTIPGV